MRVQVSVVAIVLVLVAYVALRLPVLRTEIGIIASNDIARVDSKNGNSSVNDSTVTGSEKEEEEEEGGIENSQPAASAVFHVGPHKTGSSSLQTFLVDKTTEKILALDNYRMPHDVPGTYNPYRPKNMANLAFCLHRHNKCPKKRRNRTIHFFQRWAKNASKDGSNIILSSEEFDKKGIEEDLQSNLRDLLLPFYDNIHIVLYYRRFYDWVYSLYHQIHKGVATKKSRISNIRNRRRHVTFVEWYPRALRDERGPAMNINPYAVYHRFRRIPQFNVSVVNMHGMASSNHTMVSSFACNHVPDAPNLCNYSQAVKAPTANEGSLSLDFLSLIDSAKQNQYINMSQMTNQQILKLMNDTRIRHEQKVLSAKSTPSGKYPPQKCLSQEVLEDLLNRSLHYERELTPVEFQNSEQGLAFLRKDFEAKRTTRLCSIDGDAAVLTEGWEGFFREFSSRDKKDG